jgi:hypothetical protein
MVVGGRPPTPTGQKKRRGVKDVAQNPGPRGRTTRAGATGVGQIQANLSKTVSTEA